MIEQVPAHDIAAGEMITVQLCTVMLTSKLREVCVYFGMSQAAELTDEQMRQTLAVCVTAKAQMWCGRAC